MSLLVVKSVVCHNKTPAVTTVTYVSSLIIETNGGSRNSLVSYHGNKENGCQEDQFYWKRSKTRPGKAW